jgi:hypothetical protein
MADNDAITPETFSQQVLAAFVELIRSANTPELVEAQTLLIRRLALTGGVIPSRIPPPANISEVGGYLNLLTCLRESEMRAQTLASVLGVAGPNPQAGWLPTGPVLFFMSRRNDRPAGPRQAAIPVDFTVRSDFAAALDAALNTIREQGCAVPILSPVRALPPAAVGAPPPADLLPYIGRTLDLVPSAALVDPTQDALAVGNDGTLGDTVVARQLDPNAPNAAAVAPANWDLWQCSATLCSPTSIFNGLYLVLTPILNGAGWYQPPVLTAPSTLSQPGDWARWTNVTGLVAGVTRYGDELKLLYTMPQIVASSLRDRLLWVWNGTQFISP